MKDYILIRGPIGVGKTAVGSLLSDRLKNDGYNNFLLSLDKFRNENVGKEVTYLNKKRAIELVVPKINDLISYNCIPIVEDVLYEQDMLFYLINNIEGNSLRIKLMAPFDICIKRDCSRKFPRGKVRVEVTWQMLQKDDPNEFRIETKDMSIEDVVNLILSRFISF